MKNIITFILKCVLFLFIVLCFIFLIVRVVVICNNKTSTSVAKDYLEETYTFKWKIANIKNFLGDYHEVEVIPVETVGVDRFKINIHVKEVVSDTFIKEYTCKRLEEYFINDLKQIWGDDIYIKVKIRSSDLEDIPLIYSYDTPLEVMISDSNMFSQQSVIVFSKLDLEKEQIAINIWDSIEYLRSVFPNWKTFEYYKEENGHGYMVKDINSINTSESIWESTQKNIISER